MPITEELRTAQELREAGLPQRVAELLAAKLEGTAQAARDTAFRDFLAEIRDLRADLTAQMSAHKAEMDKSLRSVQGTLLTAILGAASVGVAVLVALKLFSGA